MQKELDSLVRKLDRKILVDWVEEMRIGKPAYDHLLTCVRSPDLTRHQRANALHALFRLMPHGSTHEIFELLRSHAVHSELRVRSAAVKLLIGMLKLHNFQAPFQPSACANEINNGLRLGLDHDVAALATDSVEQHGEA